MKCTRLDAGAAGIEQVLSLRPDVAIVDIGLPDMDGYEVARQIRKSETGRDIKLVALTGYGQDEDRQRAVKAGFDRHLVKPATLETLRTVIDDMTAR